MKKQQKPKPFNVEFGNEFGDMNASKLYEFPLSCKEKKQSKKKNH
ncbi:hypothetical protein [Bacillus sp. REN3]|nr:hypothetical protein [Bacillus sp. REN3]